MFRQDRLGYDTTKGVGRGPLWPRAVKRGVCRVAERNDMAPEDGLRQTFEESSRHRLTAFALIVLFCLAWGTDLILFSLGHASVLTGESVDFMSLVVFVAVGGAVCYTFYQLRSAAWIRRLMLVGLTMGIASQCGDYLDNFDFSRAYPLLEKNNPLHETLEQGLLIGGILAFVCGVLLAILKGEVTTLRLEGDRHSELGREPALGGHGFRKPRDEQDPMAENHAMKRSESDTSRPSKVANCEQDKVALEARLRLEKGLATCSRALLSESVPLGGGVGKALAVCREVWGCDRVVLCENREMDDGTLVLGMVFSIYDDVPDHWSIAYPQVVEPYSGGLERWRTEFEAGRPISGPVKDLPEEEQARLTSYGVVSLLAVPLRWHDAWQGCLILTDCHAPRPWPEEDIVPLFTLAGMLGAHYELTSVEETLRKAYDALELRVAERTRSLTEANRKLTEEIAFRKRAEEDNARLEERLRSVQKFQAIATLAAGISHDFNNILAAITGFSEMGVKRSEDYPRLHRYFKEILASGQRATELVRRLLVFSRQAEHQLVPISITDLVRDVAAHLRGGLPPGVTLTDYTKPGLPMVLADPERMREALMMLGQNAIEAVKKKGGSIEIRADESELHRDLQTSHGVLGAGHYVRVTVQDDGPGMDPETRERVFEPFFTTKGVGEGSGMGLATVYGTITRHNGAIRVESNPGRGAAFQVFLPVHDPKHGNSGAPGLRTGDSREHILLVDDEAHLVDLWEEALQRYGYRTSAFSSSLEAKAAFAANPDAFDLVLTDNVMPALSGMDFARWVLEVRPGIPIIMATGFSESVSEEEVKAAGIYALILKPIVGSELTVAVRKALDEAKAGITDPA